MNVLERFYQHNNLYRNLYMQKYTTPEPPRSCRDTHKDISAVYAPPGRLPIDAVPAQAAVDVTPPRRIHAQLPAEHDG